MQETFTFKYEEKINSYLFLKMVRKFGTRNFVCKFVKPTAILNPRTHKKIAHTTTIYGKNIEELKKNFEYVKNGYYLVNVICER